MVLARPWGFVWPGGFCFASGFCSGSGFVWCEGGVSLGGLLCASCPLNGAGRSEA